MKDFEDALLDLSWNILESENRRYNEIDTKATGIITISAVLISFLTAFNPEGSSPLLLALTIISFIVTVFLSVVVIQTRKAEVISTQSLINNLKDCEAERQIHGILGTAAKAETITRNICNKKAAELTTAVRSLAISVFLLAIYAMSPFFKPAWLFITSAFNYFF